MGHGMRTVPPVQQTHIAATTQTHGTTTTGQYGIYMYMKSGDLPACRASPLAHLAPRSAISSSSPSGTNSCDTSGFWVTKPDTCTMEEQTCFVGSNQKAQFVERKGVMSTCTTQAGATPTPSHTSPNPAHRGPLMHSAHSASLPKPLWSLPDEHSQVALSARKYHTSLQTLTWLLTP